MISSPPRHEDTKKAICAIILHSSSFILFFLFAFRLSPYAFADGTIDVKINPTTTFTISSPGSYRLVDDVTMTADVAAITISSDNVTLELNGHTITGFSGGTSSGISAQNSVVITEGRVVGFGGYGILAGARARIERIEARGNNKATSSAAGIVVGANSAVRHCNLSDNGSVTSGNSFGIYLNGANCIAEGNIVEHHYSANTCSGIYGIGGACQILNNQIRDNQSGGIGNCYGIYIQGSGVVRGNDIELNTSPSNYYGIYVVSGNPAIESNTVGSNSASSNVTGIYTAAVGVLRGNSVCANISTDTGSAYGIFVGASSCVIEGNTCNSQQDGPNGNGTAAGIYCSGGSATIINNNCCYNAAANSGTFTGFGIGIAGGTASLVQGNTCIANTGRGASDYGAGILCTSSCRVIGNHCQGNTGATGATGHGIRLTGAGDFVADNSTAYSSTAGVIFVSATNNRSERNRFRETTGVDTTNGVAPASAGAGDLADVTY